MKYKFKVGDRVKIVENGHGCSATLVGEVVTIESLGKYGREHHPGYIIVEKGLDTNSANINGYFHGFIGEQSFRLFENDFPSIFN